MSRTEAPSDNPLHDRTSTSTTHLSQARQQKTGRVVSDKMQKTIVVAVETFQRDRVYKRTRKVTTRFKAHDEQNSAHIGDVVRIEETRPLSKEKHFRLLTILQRAPQVISVEQASELLDPGKRQKDGQDVPVPSRGRFTMIDDSPRKQYTSAMKTLEEAFKAYELSEPEPTTGGNSDGLRRDRGEVHITRVLDGFEVSGSENYFCHAPGELVDQLMDSIVLPIAVRRQQVSLDELVSASEREAKESIPWAGIYLLAQWRLSQSEGNQDTRDAGLHVVSNLLEGWYQWVRSLRPKAAID